MRSLIILLGLLPFLSVNAQDYKSIKDTLQSIYQKDQEHRREVDRLARKYGGESEEVKQHWKITGKQDSVNLKRVQEILDEHGWLGAGVIGTQANSTLFLVIQHANKEVQEKYLPMMQTAVSQGKANPAHLAMLEDRISIQKGEKQMYGTQIGKDPDTGLFFVFPLEDPENVDKRRRKVGLGPFTQYVADFGIKWNVDSYIAQLPEYEVITKKILLSF